MQKKKRFKKFFFRKKFKKKKKLLKHYLYRKYLLNYLMLKRMSFRISLTRTKNNFFFCGAKLTGHIVFWFTGKQYGFKRKQLRSPYVLETFYDLFYYLLKQTAIKNIYFTFAGKKKYNKFFLYYLFRRKYFISKIFKLLPISFNGCKLRHKRRL